MTRTHSNSDPEKLRSFAIEAARLLLDRKCSDVVLLDVRGHSQICDYVAIGTGTSQRQMRSVAEELEEVGASMGFPVYRSSRDDGTTWIVADFVDVIVHLFEPEQRLYYDLELMWADAGRVEWRRPAGSSPRKKAPATAPDQLDKPVEAQAEKPATRAAAKPATKAGSRSTRKSVGPATEATDD